MTKARTVFLIENVWGGHNKVYLARLSEAFAAAGCKVIALCPAAEEVPLRPGTEVMVRQLPDLPAKRFDFSYWQWLKKTVEGQKKTLGMEPDLVFIPYLDQALFPAYNRFPGPKKELFTQFFPYNWAGLYFHPGFNQYPASEVLFQSKRCKAVAVLNPLEKSRLQERVGEKAVLFPDFADLSFSDDSGLIRKLKGAANGKPIVCNIGSLARRKGVLTMLDMAQLDNPGRFFYFFAGKLLDSDFTRPELNRLSALSKKEDSNILLHLQPISSEEEYNGLIRASNFVYVGYQDFPSSSNQITKASAFQKPILASYSGYIGYVTKEFHLGLAFDEFDPADGLKKLNDLAETFQFDAGKHRLFNEAMEEQRMVEQVRSIVESL